MWHQCFPQSKHTCVVVVQVVLVQGMAVQAMVVLVMIIQAPVEGKQQPLE